MEIVRRPHKKQRKGPGGGKGGRIVDVKPEVKMASIIDKIMQMANNVYNTLGSGHTESVYHRAMEVELRSSGLMYESEVVTPIFYRGYYVGYGRADIVVNRNSNNPLEVVIVELKALSNSSFKINEVKRLETYMKSLEIQQGLMVNFPQLTNSAKCNFQLIPIAAKTNN